jgi:predicted outer membrane repeat protein
MSDCLFTHNEAGWLESTNTWWAYGGEGGGACLENGSTLTAQDVVFDSNHTWYAGAGLALLGAGTSADLRGCTFVDNTTSTDVSQDGPRQSGAALFVEDASVALDDVKFASNWCNRFGGAIAATGSCSVTAAGCVFVANHAFFGGAIYGDVYAVSCTFAGNDAYTGSSVYGGPVVANCILGYDPGGSEIAGAVVNHCCLADSQQSSDLCDGPEVFCADPLYCSTQAQDFSLCSDSPCLPTNNVWGELIGAFGEGCGPCGTSVLETSWGSIKAMFRGE